MNSDWILLENFIRNHPLEAARILERQGLEETASLFSELPVELATSLLKKMQSSTAVKCLELMPILDSAKILEKLPLDIVALFLRQVANTRREEILSKISEEIASLLRTMLLYPENSAGALADPLIFSLPEDITVEEALDRIRARPGTAIYYVYIVNRENILRGVINLRELMLAKSHAKLSGVMQTNVAALPAEFNLQAIINFPSWKNYHALPVVSASGLLLGAIRYETLRQIESEVKSRRLPRQVVAAGSALGELFQIGLSGLIQSATTKFIEPSREE